MSNEHVYVLLKTCVMDAFLPYFIGLKAIEFFSFVTDTTYDIVFFIIRNTCPSVNLCIQYFSLTVDSGSYRFCCSKQAEQQGRPNHLAEYKKPKQTKPN